VEQPFRLKAGEVGETLGENGEQLPRIC